RSFHYPPILPTQKKQTSDDRYKIRNNHRPERGNRELPTSSAHQILQDSPRTRSPSGQADHARRHSLYRQARKTFPRTKTTPKRQEENAGRRNSRLALPET